MPRAEYLRYRDHRACPHCGAPAARIGSVYSEYDGDTLTGSKLAPVTLMLPTIVYESDGKRCQRPVNVNDRGAVTISESESGNGFGTSARNVHSRYGVPDTHECRGDVMGGVSCGGLRSTVAYKGEMPAECFYDPDMIPSKETP